MQAPLSLDCHGYTGKIAGMARDLQKELRVVKYDRFAAAIEDAQFKKPFSRYREFCELLGAMTKFRYKKGCRDSGVPPFCRIRKCCQEKKPAGCRECGEPDGCVQPDFPEPFLTRT